MLNFIYSPLVYRTNGRGFRGMPPGPSPGHINMETHFGARDGHCQHGHGPQGCFCQNSWLEKPLGVEGGVEGAPGSWHPQEMEANPASPPCPSLVRKMGIIPPNMHPSQARLLPAQRDRDGCGWREAPRGMDGWMDGRMDRRCSDP